MAAPAVGTYVEVVNLDRDVESYPDGRYALAATHTQSLRVSGISEPVPHGTLNRYAVAIVHGFG